MSWMKMMLTLTWTTTANSANMALLHINFNCMTQLHQNLLDRLLMMLQRNMMLRSWIAQLMLMSSMTQSSKWIAKSINLNNLLSLHFPMLQQLLPRQ